MKISRWIWDYWRTWPHAYQKPLAELAVAVEGEEYRHDAHYKWIGRLQIFSLIVLNAADAILTYFGFAIGTSELNPFFNIIGVHWIIPVKIVGVGIAVWAWNGIRKKNPISATLIFTAAIATYSFLMLWHALQLFIMLMWAFT